MMKVWSTASLAMLLCLGGTVLPFFPWAEVTVVTFDPAAQPPPPKGSVTQEIKGGSKTQERVYGFQLRSGVASAAAFLAGFLLLVITGPLRPTPVWRSAVLLACGLAALAAAIAVLAFPPEALRSSPEAGRVVFAAAWGYPHLLALLLSGGLMLVAAVELRQQVGRWVRDRDQPRPQGPAEPGAAADRAGTG